MRTRTRTAACVLAVAASLSPAAAGWACVPQPMITSIEPRASGPAGAQVTVVGNNFDPAPVEIRWNGLQGQLLGKTDGPSFSVPITLPDDPAGLYVLTAISRQPGGEVGGTARASFQLQALDQPAPSQAAAPIAQPAAGTVSEGAIVGAAVGVFGAGVLTMLLCSRLRHRGGD